MRLETSWVLKTPLCIDKLKSKQPESAMKHWATLALLMAFRTSFALADDFKTSSGKEYRNATLSRVEADGIVLRTKSGIVILYFSELPKDAQEQFHDNPSKTTGAASPFHALRKVSPPKMPAAVEKLQRRGLLHLDCTDPDAKAWIAPAAWKMWDTQERENVSKNLAEYCHPQSPSVWILDKQSGRKIASYGPLGRFKTY